MRTYGEKKLTKEQQELVTRNIKLTYFLLNKLALDKDKYEDVCFEALCHAALTFDETKGIEFSTWLRRNIIQHVWEEKRDDEVRKFYTHDYSFVSLDSPFNSEDDPDITVADTISNTESDYAEFEIKELYRKFKNKQSEKDKVLLTDLESGMSITDIAEKHGVSKQSISSRKIALQKKFHGAYLRDTRSPRKDGYVIDR